MSERGSFVTEYIHCDKCLAAAKRVLLQRDKFLCSTMVPGWSPDAPELPIIAGKVGDLYRGGEMDTFEYDLGMDLAQVICHPMRIAVLAGGGEMIICVEPEKS